MMPSRIPQCASGVPAPYSASLRGYVSRIASSALPAAWQAAELPETKTRGRSSTRQRWAELRTPHLSELAGMADGALR